MKSLVQADRSQTDRSSTQSLLFIVGCAALFLLLGIGPNIGLAALAILTLLIGFALLWRPGEPPILLFAFVYQWLQASIAVFYANATGVPLDEFFAITLDATTSTMLSLIALIAIAIGMRLATGGARPELSAITRGFLGRASVGHWFRIYLVAAAFSLACRYAAYLVPGLSQGFVALANFKWAAFMLLTMVAVAKPLENRMLWFIAFGVEFIMSLGGFFSGFSGVFIYAGLAWLFTGKRPSAAQAVAVSALVVAVVALSVVWTAVKTDYRTFVSGGANDQTVVVEPQESIAKLIELISALDSERLKAATTALIKRISYVEFFGAATEYVPSVVPYENGALWLDALSRPFKPRIFFPEKTELDDSAQTFEYTGLRVAGSEQNTSISMGYIGETYIDFGKYLMLVPLFVAGYFVGRAYMWLLTHRVTGPVSGLCLATVLVMTISKLETTLAKSIGGFIATYLVTWLLIRFVLKPLRNQMKM